MPNNPEELEKALKAFRQDVLKAFANLHMEIEALQTAVVEKQPVSQKRLEELRETAAKHLHKLRDHYAETISSAHEYRETR